MESTFKRKAHSSRMKNKLNLLVGSGYRVYLPNALHLSALPGIDEAIDCEVV